jgi:hypothetical protein
MVATDGNLSKLALAFVALVVLHVCLALSFKLAQHGSSAEYAFLPAVLLVVAELVKFSISSILLWRDALLRHGIATAENAEHTPHIKLIAPSIRTSIWLLNQEVKLQVTFSLVWRTALLASLYCLNNNLAFALFRVADGANITLIKSGGSVVSALLLRFALKRSISPIQWSAIWLQAFGLIVAQFGTSCSNTPVLSWHAYGLLLLSLLISSVCGVWNDHMLKDERHHAASMHVINTLLYAYGFLFNALAYAASAAGTTGTSTGSSILAGFDEPATYLVLACQSLFGVAISAMYKYADAAVKTFALSCATILLMTINVLAFGTPFSLVVTMGCLTVFVATHLYVANPTSQATKKLRIVAEERVHQPHKEAEERLRNMR